MSWALMHQHSRHCCTIAGLWSLPLVLRLIYVISKAFDASFGDWYQQQSLGHGAGTFWGELGFFKLERGVNTLQIESGDCWYAEPEYKLEEEVREGDLVGSMYGLIPRNHSTPHLSLA